MTAERPGGDHPPQTISPPNVEAPAVSLCPGFYTLRSAEDGFSDCNVCGITGETGEPCDQTVIV